MDDEPRITNIPAARSARRLSGVLGFVALLCGLLPLQLWAVAALYFDVRVAGRAPLNVAYW